MSGIISKTPEIENSQEIQDAEDLEGSGEVGQVDESQIQGQSMPENPANVQPQEITQETAPIKVDYDKLYQRFLGCISFIRQHKPSADQDLLIREFLTTGSFGKLIVYLDESNSETHLHVSSNLSSSHHENMLYFIKYLGENEVLNENNFEEKVQYGKMKKNTMESLQKTMAKVYVPIFLSNKKWPDSVRKEFNSQLHRFMAFLTDTVYQLKGNTVLFVPEGYEINVEDAAHQKDVVQRLEVLLVHWTKQIKEVLNAQNSSESTENSGPLDEIKFWKSRCDDLSGLSEQINREEVKTIIKVLDIGKSSFLDQFLRLSNLIQEGTLEAQDNLKYLSTLSGTCHKLAQSEPREIINLLPVVLRCIRLIWANSSYYNTKERITGILRKISNEIIRRCCAKISLDDIFHGDVYASIVSIQDSINCGEQWKAIYKNYCTHVHKFTGKQWDFDQSSIFAQIDAFIRRCKDLLEVCEGQIQFARKGPDGVNLPIPIFGGISGSEITKGLQDIEDAFIKLTGSLWNIRKYILDVKATRWHDDYNNFKQGVKDLEVMMQNLIISAFDGVLTVESGVELLDSFFRLAKRDAIKRTVEKKTFDVYQILLNEFSAIKLEFETNRKTPSILRSQPDFAGSAYWAKSLLSRTQHSMAVLVNAYYLPPTILDAEAKAQFEAIVSSIEEYIAKTHAEWISNIPANLSDKLNNPLMIRKGDLLQLNLDKDLIRLFAEINYFQKIKADVPFDLQEINSKREELRILKENVSLVVRDYNSIMKSLSSKEHLLFRERIKFIDRKVNPGIVSLNWDSKGVTDFFVKECKRHLTDTQQIVNEFLDCNAQISVHCNTITQTLLWNVENKKIYELEEFEKSQRDHQELTKGKLVKVYEQIAQTLGNTFQIFANDGAVVYNQWMKYVEGIDSRIEGCLRSAVKRSLNEISKAINGEGKDRESGNEVHPLFKVHLILESQKVDFSPKFSTLQDTLNKVARDMINVISIVPRLSEKLCPENANKIGRFYDIISSEDDVLKILVNIQNGMAHNTTKCHSYLRNWDSYREIWEINKDAFIRRYAKLKPPLSTFDADINRYNEVGSNAQKEETLTNISFVRLDCSLLKQSIVSHCSAWQSKLTTLLNQLAVTDLNSLYEMFQSNTEKLKKPPKDLDKLVQGLQLLAQLDADKQKIESQFAPIHEMYAILETYEFQIKDEEKQKLNNLSLEWQIFQETLVEADKQYNVSKGKFKNELLASSEEFLRSVSNIKEDFNTRGPFKYAEGVDSAMKRLDAFRKILANASNQEKTLKKGLAIFKIDQAPSKELELISSDLELLAIVWSIAQDWNNTYAAWRTIPFLNLDANEIEDSVQKISKRILKLGKEVKDWEVYSTLKELVSQTKRTIPLLLDLRNPAMRERHWNQIMDEVGITFNPLGSDFTLDKIFELSLDQHTESIAGLSIAATKELSIETGLAGIADAWKVLNIDIIPYKEEKGYHKIRSTEEIFELLEDNQVTLSTMKASKYFKAFESTVDSWERSLSLVVEVIECLLLVQKQWMYLENIFVGAEDIRKQLPKESVVFDKINMEFKAKMVSFLSIKNVLAISKVPNVLEDLNTMNLELEKIQKSLDMYLETKRQSFPRFYFLSNDDLLEILGQVKNPNSVQPHLKKCFDNLHKLELIMAGTDGRRHSEAVGMHSGDGEYVPFIAPVIVEGPVEIWLTDIEQMMIKTLRKLLGGCLSNMKKAKKDKWLKDWAGMLLITSGLIQWTSDCTKALTEVEKGEKGSLRNLKKKQISTLKKFADIVKLPISKIERKKLISLITIEVHSRDVIDKIAKNNCSNVNAFEWLSQLRFYWERENKEDEDCVIRQINTQFKFGYEYLGNSGRLVITPLTDRCYMTLTTALHLFRGGSPQGPAGTGKTETVKDLGKGLGKYVIVFNCSDALDYKSIGRMFSGLSQTGAWGCFDEFNRIDIEVLSVVALQISTILTAVSKKVNHFVFEGREIRLVTSVGIFITMNPGYAGRVELPDNLKSLFRPVSMMVPDSALIAEIMLFAEGFSNTRNLAKKVDTLYKLSIQQLSKQDHYDFGLRALTTALRSAGNRKRLDTSIADEIVLFMAMRDNNIPKLTADDVPLFNGILSDLFPGVEGSPIDYTILRTAISESIKDLGLQQLEETYSKVIQLYETKCSRHGVMIVGETGSGKSTAWKLLQESLAKLSKSHSTTYVPAKTFTINPKSLSLTELYGEFNLSTNEWTDGVLSSVMRTACSDEKKDEKWIVLDGPVDTLWIESMNTVLDDNKVLTLINGERIALPEQVSLLFEVENLSTASPATVSRCGMIYTDYSNLGWRPIFDSWLANREDKQSQDILKRLGDKYLSQLLEFRRTCVQFVHVPESAAIKSLCALYDSIATVENGVNYDDPDGFTRIIELWFLFSVIWAFGGSLTAESRFKFDSFFREIEGQFPSKDTVFEYFVEKSTKSWVAWEDKLPTNWRYSSTIPFYKIFVPTVDTFRNEFIFKSLISHKKPVLLVGDVGTGKTALAQNTLFAPENTFNVLILNMSAQTSSESVQNVIEGKLEKRTKNVYVPAAGKSLTCFIDDLNMPSKDTFGSQPPLELIRHYMDYGFVYDRGKQSLKFLNDIHMTAAMGPPGGGRNVISPRIQSRFNILNMTFPSETSISRIFLTIVNQKLQEFEEDVKSVGELLVPATIDIFRSIIDKLLPTPAKMHYLFNLRDISKVFQGIMRATKEFYDSSEQLLKLWIHEMARVFSDRLINKTDKTYFKGLLEEKLGSVFQHSLAQLGIAERLPIFGDFMGIGNTEFPQYEEITNMDQLKKFMEDKLEEYNNEPGMVALDLVLFHDAIEHICRLTRILRQPCGNSFLIGVGGSGRQSLSRVAGYLVQMDVFQIKLSKNYRHVDFREDIKKVFKAAGLDNKPTLYLMTDQQILNDLFLEDISNILSSGEVPNLFAPEEMTEIKNSMQAVAKGSDTADQLYAMFIERVRNNLHIVLCMSPVGDAFRRRLRMFPSLINCTTIDWFSEWPEDALLEVATRYISKLDLGSVSTKSVASVFVSVHMSVVETSHRMIEEIKRYNYVTPINYLELVNGYRELIIQKRKEFGDAANKLRNGLRKLDDTRKNVEEISVELEVSKKQVAEFQKQCEDFLVVIVQQTREADETAKGVAAKAEKLSVEEAEVKAVADAAQMDLDQALPALNAATKALENINKKDLNEIRSYGKPPPLVEKVMEAVMVLKKCEPNWDEAKRQLGNTNFIKQLIGFDKDNISDKILKRISQYCADENFQPEIVGRVSGASKSLCMWVRAMETYGIIFRQVAPKKEKLRIATETLEKKQKSLKEAKSKLDEINHRLQELKNQYDEKAALKEKLRVQSEQTELKLTRAEKLVSGLAGERDRWEKAIKKHEDSINFLPGDCMFAAAFMSYAGPFNSGYRDQLMKAHWLEAIKSQEIPYSAEFSFDTFIGKQTDIRDWNIQGLPSDVFSSENGIIVTRGRRWPLMIDPQGQANNWIRNMERKRDLKIIDLKQTDYLRTLENSIQFGTPVLLQGVLDSIDPSLDPILNKSIVKKGGILIMKLGEKEVEYNPEFRFYITTKLNNPKYSPEVFAKTIIVNFAVKEKGLEDQLLGILVKRERPDLEEQKSALVTGMASGKRKLEELEDEILYLLSTAQGSLLDDEKLVNTLQSSKSISEDITQQLLVSEQTEKRIDLAREGYRPAAERASILYFVLNDMSSCDPMYQFSLDSYIEIFDLSISKAKKFDEINERISSLNEFHTYSVFKYTCRGLFEKHKLLFSLQMNVKILKAAGKLDSAEYDYFLRGGQVLDKESQMQNPCEWIDEAYWDNITELENMSVFSGIASSFEQNEREWKVWYLSGEPEQISLPGEWENKLNDFQKMLIVRSLRPDRVSFCAIGFVASNLGQRYVEPPILDISDVLADSNPRTPLIFVLSPGVDPTASLVQLAKRNNMEDRFNYISLGQGQAPKAIKLIKEGLHNGSWVFLANCHLSISFMPSLDKIIESIPSENPHPDFRLWLSSSPHPDFPISILQCGLKMTTEPPKGIRANMSRLFNSVVTDDAFERCAKRDVYIHLLFALGFYHSVLLERKKFLTLGWNVLCDFNDSDFDICDNLTVVLLEEYQETPWEALKYLIAEANYGGRVTDDWDRRILRSYINHYFCDEAVTTPQYKLSTLSAYYIPEASDIQTYRDYIAGLPGKDNPEVFGQHPNADIASQIKESNTILGTLLSLMPVIGSGGGLTVEDKVLAIISDLEIRIPENIDFEKLFSRVRHDMSPFNVVLLQETKRYNTLLSIIRKSLIDLQNGIKGIIVLTTDLEASFSSIFEGKVPPTWGTTYSSLKPLAGWIRDLILRIEHFNEWAKGNEPKVFWLGAFTFPTGFLTAILQRCARSNNVAVDTLSWEFVAMQDDDQSSLVPQREGVYINNLYLEGASWDRKNSCLIEPKPMELICPLPPILFKPIEAKKKATKGVYICPLYIFPIRSGTRERPSFIISMELKSGGFDQDFWIKRGTACLTSLAN